MAAQGFEQGVLVDRGSPTDVDEDRARPHGREASVREEADGVRGRGQDIDHDVRAGQPCVQLAHGPHVDWLVPARMATKTDHAHAERPEQLGQTLGNRAVADQQNRLSLQQERSGTCGHRIPGVRSLIAQRRRQLPRFG